jgi:hypothetical protein
MTPHLLLDIVVPATNAQEAQAAARAWAAELIPVAMAERWGQVPDGTTAVLKSEIDRLTRERDLLANAVCAAIARSGVAPGECPICGELACDIDLPAINLAAGMFAGVGEDDAAVDEAGL